MNGAVAELADAPDLGSGVRKDVRVQLPSAPPIFCCCYARALKAAFTRSGVSGISRTLAPVASKIALPPIAAAITVMVVSPAPVASSSGRLSSTHSIFGISKPNGKEWYVRQSTEVTFSLSRRDFFAERAAHTLQRAAFDLIAQAVGIGNGPAVDRHATSASR